MHFVCVCVGGGRSDHRVTYKVGGGGVNVCKVHTFPNGLQCIVPFSEL